MYDLYGISEMEDVFQKLMQDNCMTLKELWNGILTGHYDSILQSIWLYVKDNTVGEWMRNQDLLRSYLVLAILSALIGFLSILFGRAYISETAKYMLAMGFTIIGVGTLMRGYSILQETLQIIYTFSKVSIPIYLMTMAIAYSQTFATIFGQLFSIGIFWIEHIMITILCPACRIFGMVGIMDSLWIEGKIKRIASLIKKIILGSIKTIVCGISAFGYIQNHVLSISQEMEKSTVGTLLSLIPGLGKLAEESLSVLIGSSVLIYRTTGVFVLILLCLICLKPFLQLGTIYFTAQIGAILVSFLLDSVFVQGMETAKASHILEGMQMLIESLELMMQILFWTICFFMLMIAVSGIKQ